MSDAFLQPQLEPADSPEVDGRWLKVDCQDLTDFYYLDWSIVTNTNTNIKEYSRDMIY